MVTENDIGKDVYVIQMNGKIVNGKLDYFYNDKCSVCIDDNMYTYHATYVYNSRNKALKKIISEMKKLYLNEDVYNLLLGRNYTSTSVVSNIRNRNFCYFFYGHGILGIGVILSNEPMTYYNEKYLYVINVNTGMSMYLNKKNIFKTKEDAIQFALRKLKENEPFIQ